MDIIYHGNCLDGAFSSFSMFVFLNLLNRKYQGEYKNKLSEILQKYIHNQPIELQQVLISENNPLIKKQQSFFLYDKNNKFTSIVPGSFNLGLINYIHKSYCNNYVCLVDYYGQQTQYLQSLCSKYKHVFIIDHHISGIQIIQKVQSKNITVVFNQHMCGFQLVNKFLTDNFHYDKMCPVQFLSWLKTFQKYIRKNDLKQLQTIQSKQFILGYYHFQFNMNDNNFQIFKQLANLDIGYILDKGKKLFKNHIKRLKEYVDNISQINLVYKGLKLKFLGIRTNEVEYISDLGIILSEMSCMNGMENLAMFYKYNGDTVRVSFRSRKTKQNPRALQLAQIFGGGGHLCAAGCKINKTTFIQSFGTKLAKVQKIENIEELLYTKQE